MTENNTSHLEYTERTINEMVDIRTEAWAQNPVTSHHENGTWKKTSWSEFGELIHSFSIGLRKLGFQKGQAACILSETCRHWTISDFGIISAGGITVGVYTTLTPRQTQYIICHSEAAFVVVQNKDLLEKCLEIRDQMPHVKTFIIIDTDNIDMENPELISWTDVVEMGRAEGEKALEEILEEHKSEDPNRIITYIYTSGTTGPPKGAMLSHANMLAAVRFYMDVLPIGQGDSGISFLPLAHGLQRIVDYVGYYVGGELYYARSLNTVREDICIAKPTAMASVPRIFEKIYAGVQKQAADKGLIAQSILKWAIEIGSQISRCWQNKKSPSMLLAFQYKLAYLLVFKKIKDALGGRMRIIGSGGAPISNVIQEFFHACGILIIEAWGMTETSALGTLTRPDAYKFGTVGLVAEGMEIKIADDGEILIKGPGVFSGYYKEPEKTKDSFEDGWFKTGDVGAFDKDGFLKITDRKKDLIITAYGKNISPQNIENAMKASRYISNILAYGDRQKYLVGIITLDPEEMPIWAKAHGISYNKLTELSGNSKIMTLIQSEVKRINGNLASFENLRKFRILPNDFTIESGELTPTLKVKRKVVYNKYHEMVKGLYGEDWIYEENH